MWPIWTARALLWLYTHWYAVGLGCIAALVAWTVAGGVLMVYGARHAPREVQGG